MSTDRALRRKAFIAGTATALALGALGATGGIASADPFEFDGDGSADASFGSDGFSGEADAGSSVDGRFGPGSFSGETGFDGSTSFGRDGFSGDGSGSGGFGLG